MRTCWLIVVSGCVLGASPQPAAKPDFGPLTVYEGTWRVTIANQAPETLMNKCAALGIYFACSQNVNGAESGLLIFIPSGAAGHYLTQSIRPDGRATGLDQMQIGGNVWTFMSRRDEYGKTTFYRTLNTFSGKNHIHFESGHSSDQKNWTVDRSGDDTRIGASH